MWKIGKRVGGVGGRRGSFVYLGIGLKWMVVYVWESMCVVVWVGTVVVLLRR